MIPGGNKQWGFSITADFWKNRGGLGYLYIKCKHKKGLYELHNGALYVQV